MNNLIIKSRKNQSINYNRIGETNYNKYGSKMTIIEYNKSDDITIEFDNGCRLKSTYYRFKKGSVKSPFCKTILEVGIVGLQNINPNIDSKYKKSYDKWRSMLTRCYNKNFKNKHFAYRDVNCCNEWLFYPNFKKWYDENYYEIHGEQMHLDKDILIKGNKTYSSETCVFVPSRINSIFTKCDKARGKYPIGVNYNKKRNKYVSQCNDELHGVIGLGSFENPIDAFYKYKNYKEKNIKIIANYYKDKIPKKLYDAMHNWEVEIDD